jgi:hypothetical protein
MSAENALTLLLPSWSRIVGRESAPTLLRWLARGDRGADAPAGRDAALRRCFEFIGPSLPVAALTRSLDANDAATAQWLRADPAYVMADAVTVRLLACGNLELTDTEVDGFGQALKPLFGDAGFLLETTRPDRWYVRCPREALLPTFSSPADALGDDLAQHLPEGDSAQRWRALLNEAQIILHQHPLNAQRARSGLAPVNSLWFWGAGNLPQWVRSDLACVYSDDEIATALARLANVACTEKLPGEFATAESADENTCLVDLAGQRNAGVLENPWFVPIGAALRRGKIAALHLFFESGEWVTVKRAHRWRFWRRLIPTS